jgi:hypothetical protein
VVTPSTSSSETSLSDYELLRLSNIKRNEEYLKCLGLDSSSHMEEKLPLNSIKSKSLKRNKSVDILEDRISRRQSRRISIANNRMDPNYFE